MLIHEDTTAVIASRACELAHTGAFEDYPAIERELFAEGFREEIDRAKKAALQSVITEICDTKREAPAQRSMIAPATKCGLPGWPNRKFPRRLECSN